MDWFRWHHGSVTDPKFRLVAKKAQASVAEVVAVWAFVLETASQNPERGAFGEIDTEALDLALGMDDGTTDRILSAMHDRALIADGRIPAWDKRQPKREDSTAAERQRLKRQREQELALAQAAAVTGDASRAVTQCHAASRAVTPEEKREEKKDQKQDQEQKHERVPRSAGRFEDFWQAYPNKKGRKDAEKAWARKGLDAQADLILADVRRRQVHDRDWQRGYVPHGSTYVSAEGWRDGLPPVPLPQQAQPMQPSRQMQAIQNILGVTLENDSPARLVLDLDASRPGADVRALPARLAGG
jgi:hypothetical protein